MFVSWLSEIVNSGIVLLIYRFHSAILYVPHDAQRRIHDYARRASKVERRCETCFEPRIPNQIGLACVADPDRDFVIRHRGSLARTINSLPRGN